MTGRRGWYLLALAAITLVIVAAWCAGTRSRAHADLAAALDRHRQVERDVATITTLGSSSSSAGAGAGLSVGPRPDADLVARTQQALAEAGLPIGACSGVQPRADQVRQQGLSVQTVLVSLQNLRPAEFGSWLAAWNAHQPPWRITELQLVHAPQRDGATSDLDPNRFDYTLALAAPYLEKQP
ncbi:MAG: hypothetical protein H0V44_16980 [Planctomycetes bacterium]|nr:hypothetical protein [Planctomycetota bacterium]